MANKEKHILMAFPTKDLNDNRFCVFDYKDKASIANAIRSCFPDFWAQYVKDAKWGFGNYTLKEVSELINSLPEMGDDEIFITIISATELRYMMLQR